MTKEALRNGKCVQDTQWLTPLEGKMDHSDWGDQRQNIIHMRLWHKCYLFDLWGWCKTAEANIDWWEVRIVVFVLYCTLKGRPRGGRPGDQGSMKCEHGQLMSLWKGTDGDGNKVLTFLRVMNWMSQESLDEYRVGIQEWNLTRLFFREKWVALWSKWHGQLMPLWKGDG